MSGGSWNYLYSKDNEPFLHVEDVEGMANRLVALGYEAEAAEMFDLAILLRRRGLEVARRWASLERVMHALEWFDSGDFGRGDLDKAIAEHRE